jgi:hypothetical protein
MGLIELVKYINDNDLFAEAHKRRHKYKRVFEHNHMKPYTYFILPSDSPSIKITTVVGDETETVNRAKPGDIIICGPFNEQYIVHPHKLVELYNVNEGVIIPRNTPRKVFKVTRSFFKKFNLINPTEFRATWGEYMILRPGDYIVKDGSHVYRIEKKAFGKTYITINK